MIFIINERTYAGETAIEIIRQLECITPEYDTPGGSIRDFLIWSLERMADRIPPRELDVSPSLDDEMIAFNYLCLLDSFRIGELHE